MTQPPENLKNLTNLYQVIGPHILVHFVCLGQTLIATSLRSDSKGPEKEPRNISNATLHL